MGQFMVNISLPVYFDEEFVSLIPKQRLHIDRLMSENVVHNYSLSLDRTKLWIVISGEDEKDIVQTLHSFPLIDWMKYDICPLMFHLQNFPMPSFSLN